MKGLQSTARFKSVHTRRKILCGPPTSLLTELLQSWSLLLFSKPVTSYWPLPLMPQRHRLARWQSKQGKSTIALHESSRASTSNINILPRCPNRKGMEGQYLFLSFPFKNLSRRVKTYPSKHHQRMTASEGLIGEAHKDKWASCYRSFRMIFWYEESRAGARDEVLWRNLPAKLGVRYGRRSGGI